MPIEFQREDEINGTTVYVFEQAIAPEAISTIEAPAEPVRAGAGGNVTPRRCTRTPARCGSSRTPASSSTATRRSTPSRGRRLRARSPRRSAPSASTTTTVNKNAEDWGSQGPPALLHQQRGSLPIGLVARPPARRARRPTCCSSGPAGAGRGADSTSLDGRAPTRLRRRTTGLAGWRRPSLHDGRQVRLPALPVPGQRGRSATRIAVPGSRRPRSGDQPPQACSLRAGHSGSTRSTSTSPAATTWRTRSPSVRWCSA